MSDLALHVVKLATDPSYARALDPEIRFGALVAYVARLIRGEYVLGEMPILGI